MKRQLAHWPTRGLAVVALVVGFSAPGSFGASTETTANSAVKAAADSTRVSSSSIPDEASGSTTPAPPSGEGSALVGTMIPKGYGAFRVANMAGDRQPVQVQLRGLPASSEVPLGQKSTYQLVRAGRSEMDIVLTSGIRSTIKLAMKEGSAATLFPRPSGSQPAAIVALDRLPESVGTGGLIRFVHLSERWRDFGVVIESQTVAAKRLRVSGFAELTTGVHLVEVQDAATGVALSAFTVDILRNNAYTIVLSDTASASASANAATDANEPTLAVAMIVDTAFPSHSGLLDQRSTLERTETTIPETTAAVTETAPQTTAAVTEAAPGTTQTAPDTTPDTTRAVVVTTPSSVPPDSDLSTSIALDRSEPYPAGPGELALSLEELNALNEPSLAGRISLALTALAAVLGLRDLVRRFTSR
jgi:hypothetical protein